MSRILVVDNYDSFVYTIVGYLEQLGAKTTVVRNDAVPQFSKGEYDGILVSPGPGMPTAAGASLEVIHRAAELELPLLGVCLGHQALAEAYGGKVTHAPELMHGRTSQVFHSQQSVLAGLPTPFTATRYHSLAVDPSSVPKQLEVTATTDNGIIMGLAHRTLPLHGVQFHPESVLTEGGHRLLANWLELTGLEGVVERSAALRPQI